MKKNESAPCGGSLLNGNEGYFSFAVLIALWRCDEEKLQEVVDKYTVDAQTRGGIALLMAAAEYAYVASARFLLDRGAAVNLQDNKQKTALHYACISQMLKKEMLTLLLEAGADPTLKDSQNRTPRDYM